MAEKITGLLGDYRPVNERIKDVPGAVRRYMQKSLLLDSPEMTGGETAADIALGFVPGVGTAMGARDFERARRDGDGLGMALGAAGMLPVVGGLLGKSARLMDRAKDGADLSRVVPQISGRGKAAAESQMLRQSLKADADPANYLNRPTVRDPSTVAYPDIYMRPDKLVARARVAPEDESMKRLFGVTRDDLYEMSKRSGNIDGMPFKTAANPKGAKHAEQVMTPENEQRILDIIGEAQKRPDLWKGMHGWYPMDPLYDRMKELVGPEKAKYHYGRLNGFIGMSSPNSEVLTEINRGTGANWLAEQGRFGDFQNFAGLAESKRGSGFPDDMRGIQGHMVHSTAQAGPMAKSLQKGFVDMDSAKVPSYIWASGVPDMGFQTQWPVGDAHWSRLVALPDVRGFNRDKKSGLLVPNGASASVPEMVSLGPWWKDKIAGQAGLESVPGQAIVWGAGSNATGVTSPIGAPKLELFSQQIMKAADRMGVSPESARDMILLGKGHAGFADPMMLGGAALGVGGGLLGYNYLNSGQPK
jgi:hypothetical protein